MHPPALTWFLNTPLVSNVTDPYIFFMDPGPTLIFDLDEDPIWHEFVVILIWIIAVLILDGNSEHVAHVWKENCCRSKQMRGTNPISLCTYAHISELLGVKLPEILINSTIWYWQACDTKHLDLRSSQLLKYHKVIHGWLKTQNRASIGEFRNTIFCSKVIILPKKPSRKPRKIGLQ